MDNEEGVFGEELHLTRANVLGVSRQPQCVRRVHLADRAGEGGCRCEKEIKRPYFTK